MAADATHPAPVPSSPDPAAAGTPSVPSVAEMPGDPTLLDQLRGLWTPRDRLVLAIVLAVVLVSVALRVVTWDVIADGARGRYVKLTVFGAAASLLVWLLLRLQASPRSLVPPLCAVAVLLAGDAIHYERRLNPLSLGAPVRSVAGPFTDEAAVKRQWDVETAGGGSARFESGAVNLVSPAGASAYLRARVERPPDAAVNWWLPVGVTERPRVETLAWRGTVSRTGGYYTVLDVPTLLVQVVSYGIHVTYPDEKKAMVGHEVQHPVGSDGRAHDWQVVRRSDQIALSLDGSVVWSSPTRGDIEQMRLGETKSDPQHAGTMRVEAASYTVTLER